MDSEVLALVIRAQDEASAAVNSVKNTLGTLADKADVTGRAMSGLHSILSGIGAGIGIGIFMDLQNVFSRLTQLIPDLISKGMAFAETTHTLELQTGATAQQSSQLLGIFGYLGISTDALSTRIGILSKNAILHAAALKEIGVNIGNANTGFDNQLVILDKLRSSLSTAADGTAKMATLQTVLGRGASQLTEYFSLTDAQVKLLDTEMNTLGITMDQQGITKAESLSKEFNLLGLAVQGTANRLVNDVAPALMGVVSQISDWVAKNSAAVANFAGEAANFILGVISAITGAAFNPVTFTDQFNSLASAVAGNNAALDQFAATGGKVASAAKGATAAITDQVKAIDAQLASLKALDTAQGKVYADAMTDLNAQLTAQYSLLTVEDQRRKSAEEQARLQQTIATAAADLANAQTGGDPTQVLAAQKALNSATLAMADFQFTQSQDQRKTELDAIKANLKAIDDEVKNSTDKQATLADLRKQATVMASKQATDQQNGDQQAVADDALQMEALRTAIARTAQQTRTTASETALNAEKTHLNDLKSAAASAGAAVGGSIAAGAATGGAAIAGFTISGLINEAKLAAGFTSPSSTGMVGAFAAAKLAGEDFGASLKGTFDGLTTAVSGLVDGIAKVAPALAGIVRWIQDNKGTVELALVLVGASTGNLPAIGAALSLSATSMNDPGTFSPIEDMLGLTKGRTQKLGPAAPYSVLGSGTGGGNGYWTGSLPQPSVAPLVIQNQIMLDGQQMTNWVSKTIAGEQRSYAGPSYAGSPF